LEHQLRYSGTKIIITMDILFARISEVADKASFTTVVVSEIADFLTGVKRVLKKIMAGKCAPR
jgi:hypothetical protein